MGLATPTPPPSVRRAFFPTQPVDKPSRPGAFIFTLPFVCTFPNVLSLGAATLYFKSLGYPNGFIGHIGILFLPFGVSFLWAPLLDTIGTKRAWALKLNFLLVVAVLGLACTVWLHSASPWPTLGAISLIALLGATFEVSMNGFLLHAIEPRHQAAIAGYRLAAVRLGQIFAGGLLVKLCTDFGARRGDPQLGWTVFFLVLASCLALALVYHAWALPRLANDRPSRLDPGAGIYRHAWREIRALPAFGALVAFYLLYRLGEGLLGRMISAFLVDAPAAGGLGFAVGDTALMHHFGGGIGMIGGGIVGGKLVHRFGFRRVMLAFALTMPVTHLGYVWLATQPPAAAWHVDIPTWLPGDETLGPSVWKFRPLVQACVSLQAFGYGLGFASMFAMTMAIARGPFCATIVSLFVALWSIGWILPTLLSGVLQEALGYFWYYVVTIIAALPGILLVLRLPLRFLDERLAANQPESPKQAVP